MKLLYLLNIADVG